jgi:hypothetical protein
MARVGLRSGLWLWLGLALALESFGNEGRKGNIPEFPPPLLLPFLAFVFVWSYLVFPFRVSSRLGLPCSLISSCLVFRLVLSYLHFSCLVLPCVLSDIVLFCSLVSSCLVSFLLSRLGYGLIPLVSPRLALSHFLSRLGLLPCLLCCRVCVSRLAPQDNKDKTRHRY